MCPRSVPCVLSIEMIIQYFDNLAGFQPIFRYLFSISRGSSFLVLVIHFQTRQAGFEPVFLSCCFVNPSPEKTPFPSTLHSAHSIRAPISACLSQGRLRGFVGPHCPNLLLCKAVVKTSKRPQAKSDIHPSSRTFSFPDASGELNVRIHTLLIHATAAIPFSLSGEDFSEAGGFRPLSDRT
jgi:hypothetical protein